MYKLAVFVLLFSVSSFASEEVKEVKTLNCSILQEKNRIVCKYTQERLEEDRKVTFDWANPNNVISRTREINIVKGHGSVYDFRNLNGRQKGIWTVKVTDNKSEFLTKFEIK